MANRRSSIGEPPTRGFGSTMTPRNAAADAKRPTPMSRPASKKRFRAPRCATPDAGRPRSVRRSAEVEDEIKVRAKWSAELERTQKLLREKKRLEKEAMYRATKEAQDAVKQAELDSIEREAYLKRMDEKVWRQEDSEAELAQKQRDRREAARRRQELREEKEARRRQEAEERVSHKLEYQEARARKLEDDRTENEARKRQLRERQQEAISDRQRKKIAAAERREQERREQLETVGKEFSWRQQESMNKMQKMMVG